MKVRTLLAGLVAASLMTPAVLAIEDDLDTSDVESTTDVDDDEETEQTEETQETDQTEETTTEEVEEDTGVQPLCEPHPEKDYALVCSLPQECHNELEGAQACTPPDSCEANGDGTFTCAPMATLRQDLSADAGGDLINPDEIPDRPEPQPACEPHPEKEDAVVCSPPEACQDELEGTEACTPPPTCEPNDDGTFTCDLGDSAEQAPETTPEEGPDCEPHPDIDQARLCTPPPSCVDRIGETAACTPPPICQANGDGTYTCGTPGLATTSTPIDGLGDLIDPDEIPDRPEVGVPDEIQEFEPRAGCEPHPDRNDAVVCTPPSACEDQLEGSEACAPPPTCQRNDNGTYTCTPQDATPGTASDARNACTLNPDDPTEIRCTLPDACQEAVEAPVSCALPADCRQVDASVHACPLPARIAGMPAPTEHGPPAPDAGPAELGPEVGQQMRAAVEEAMDGFRATLDELRTTYEDEKAALEERYASSKADLRVEYEACLDEAPGDASRAERLEHERACKAQAREDLHQLREDLLAERDAVREEVIAQAEDAKAETCASLERSLHGILMDAGRYDGDLAAAVGPDELALCAGILDENSTTSAEDAGWFGGEAP